MMREFAGDVARRPDHDDAWRPAMTRAAPPTTAKAEVPVIR
jgi:hypothetical protein